MEKTNTENRKKVMQINCFYRFGSTGRIVADIHDGLRRAGIPSRVVYARRPMPAEEGVIRVSDVWEQKSRALCSRLFGQDMGRGGHGTRQILSLLRTEKPDVVHLHVLNGHFIHVYRLLEALGAAGTETVLTLHSEQFYTAGCDHAHDCTRWKSECRHCPHVSGMLSRLWRDDAARAFARMRVALAGVEKLTVVGVSPWVTARASQSPLLAGRRILTVQNGVNIEEFRPRPSLAAHLRRRWGISPEEAVVLYVTPRLDHPDKGAREAFAVFERILGRMPHARMVIVGWDGDPKRMPRDCRPPERVLARTVAVPHTRDVRTLAGFYTMADVTLLCGRRETFSMVCAESLSAGTPVAGFLSGGPESIALSAYSRFVRQKDVDSLASVALRMLEMPPEGATVAQAAAAVYDARRMVEGYLAVYGMAEGVPSPAPLPVQEARA